MRVTKKEKQQVELASNWNRTHEPGIDVIVTLDNKTTKQTKTRSKAYMLGESGDYPGHTAVIMLLGISGCYKLDRVRPA